MITPLRLSLFRRRFSTNWNFNSIQSISASEDNQCISRSSKSLLNNYYDPFIKSRTSNAILLRGLRTFSGRSSQNSDTNRSHSHLFTPIHVSSASEGEDCLGTELVGPLKKNSVTTLLKSFNDDKCILELAEEKGLDKYLYEQSFYSFQKYCLSGQPLPTDLHIVLHDLIKGCGHIHDIYPYFIRHSHKVFPHLKCMDELSHISDLTSPPNWYPEARAITRKIVFHAGPTNSGKTYNAMQRFLKAKSGLYCGPLKLLANEIYTKCNEFGTPCDLITGEERKYASAIKEGDGKKTNSCHLSCTIEMASLSTHNSVAIIDEIQMLRDRQRGWAWTRAFMGIQADEIHVCGESSAINLVKELTLVCGDEFQLNEYERLTQLNIEETALKSFDNVLPGDCIVCFNKVDIINVARTIEMQGNEVAVIYGDLPAATKLAMSEKFNDPNHACKIMVATDAIGMGMNLSIRRIVFNSIKKITTTEDNEKRLAVIDVPSALQIAGRAGRFATEHSEGFVTTLRNEDLLQLRKILGRSPSDIEQAGLAPTPEQIGLFTHYLPKYNLANIMDIFIMNSSVDSSLYFMCDLEDFKFLANIIQHIPLELKERYIYCCSPIDRRLPFVCEMFLKFVRIFHKGNTISASLIKDSLNWPFQTPVNIKQLIVLENAFEVCDLYLWYSFRFVQSYPDVDEIQIMKKEIDEKIREGINNILSSKPTQNKRDVSPPVQAKTIEEGSKPSDVNMKHMNSKDKKEKEKMKKNEPKSTKDHEITANTDSNLFMKRRLTDRLLASGLLKQDVLEKLQNEWSKNKNKESKISKKK